MSYLVNSADSDAAVTLDPPMPIYLFNLVAGLREKNAKGYPVKKVSSSFVSFDAR